MVDVGSHDCSKKKITYFGNLLYPKNVYCDHGKGLFMFRWSGHVLCYLNQGYVTLGPGEFF